MIRATMFSSSDEVTVYMRHLVFVTVCVDDCLICRLEFIPPCILDSHPHRVTNTKCRIGTVTSPYDGNIVAQNM